MPYLLYAVIANYLNLPSAIFCLIAFYVLAFWVIYPFTEPLFVWLDKWRQNNGKTSFYGEENKYVLTIHRVLLSLVIVVTL